MSISHRCLRIPAPEFRNLPGSRGRRRFLGADVRPVSTANKAVQPAESVELFAAAECGDIEAKFIPKNAQRARVILKNNTDRPLSVRLPEAFVGVPVLSQFGNFGFMNARGCEKRAGER